jgi:peptidoglycan hydrolase-like protein with peptidoglycan-binding domain
MPRLISADVLDSMADDWTITDDSIDRGPITTWPAPKLGPDDRTPTLGPTQTMTRSGLPDAYAFLREKESPPKSSIDDPLDPARGVPFSDAMGLMLPYRPGQSMRGIPQYRTLPSPSWRPDARYAGVDMYEAGMLIRNFLARTDAGALDDAGMPASWYDVISRAEEQFISLLKQWSDGKFLQSDVDKVHRAFVDIRNTATSDSKWNSFNRAKVLTFKLLDNVDAPIISGGTSTVSSLRSSKGAPTTPIVRAPMSVQHGAHRAEFDRMWKALENHVNNQRGLLGDIGSAVGSAVSSVGSAAVGVGKGVFSVAKGIATPVAALVTSPVKLASDIAQGKNVFESLKDTVKRDFASVKEVAPYAQAVISFVPGVGAGVNAAIAAGAAIAQGQPITSALVAGVKNALPGGPLAAQAFDAAYQVARGANVGDVALQALVNQIPGGEIAKQAAHAAIAVAKGQNLQQAALGVVKAAALDGVVQLPGGNVTTEAAVDLLSGKSAKDVVMNTAQSQLQKLAGSDITKAAVDLASGRSAKDVALGAAQSQLQKWAGSDVTKTAVDLASGKSVKDVALGAAKDQAMQFTNQLSPFAVGPMNATGPRILATMKPEALPGLLSKEAKLAAQSFLQTPSLRSLPIAEVARQLNLPAHIVREGAASVLQSVQRSGGAAIPMLASAKAIEQKIPFQATFDQMMSHVASRAAPPAYSHNANTQRAAQLRQNANVFRSLQAQGLGAGALDPKLMPTIRQGSSGDAVIAWQKIIGVAADGKFGPQTTAATKAFQQQKGLVADGIVGPQSWLAGLGSVLTTPITPGGPPVTPTAPPPSSTPVLTGAMPIIRRGSTGAAVKTWQGYLGITADGSFGPDTEAKTKTFQAQNGLVVDGIVGPNTWAKAMSGTSTTPVPTPGRGPVIVSTPPITLPPIIPGTPPIVVPPVVITEPPPGSPPGTPPIISTTSPPGMPPFPTTSTPATPPGMPPGIPTTSMPPGMPPPIVTRPPTGPTAPPSSKPSLVPIAVGLGLLALVMGGTAKKLI